MGKLTTIGIPSGGSTGQVLKKKTGTNYDVEWGTGGGGGGTPGGSDTQVQFNDSGAFGGDAGLTYNKTTDVLTSGGAILSGETASTIASFDGSKQIKSLSTSTYPSLTELSYVKGVTSAIQTQLNSKETDYRYEIVTVLDQDIWLNNSSITKVVKSVGINTVEYKINAGSYTALTFTSGVWTGTISITANDVLSWRITYNAGYTTGSFNVVHNRV